MHVKEHSEVLLYEHRQPRDLNDCMKINFILFFTWKTYLAKVL